MMFRVELAGPAVPEEEPLPWEEPCHRDAAPVVGIAALEIGEMLPSPLGREEMLITSTPGVD